MYILDTNIISELIRPKPDNNVIEWVKHQPLDHLYTTAISKAELYYGIQLQSDGKRKVQLLNAINEIFQYGLNSRVLGFDSRSAEYFPDIALARRLAGQPISTADAQIAAISKQYQMLLITRNINDFTGCGIELLNPFSK